MYSKLRACLHLRHVLGTTTRKQTIYMLDHYSRQGTSSRISQTSVCTNVIQSWYGLSAYDLRWIGKSRQPHSWQAPGLEGERQGASEAED